MISFPAGTLSRASAPLAVLAVAGITAACGSSGGAAAAVPSVFTPAAQPWRTAALNWPSDRQVRAWMTAHPVPARPGMAAGVVSFYGRVHVWTMPCPAGGGRGSRGMPGTCSAWQVTLVTAPGTFTVTCGDPHEACPSAAYPARGVATSTAPADDHNVPVEGDYLYAPANGQVTLADDVRVIRRDAVPLPGGA